MKKKLVTLLVLAMVVCMLPACKKEEEKKETKTETVKQAEPEEEPAEEPAAVPEEVPANQNLLTGLGTLSEGAIGKRPVAVMVSNVAGAMPQYGIEQADIVFEIPVEGMLTRLMCLYGDYTAVPQIAPVRSCRKYFPMFSQGFDAFYVNWGIDDSIDHYLAALNFDQYDGMTDGNGLFGRDAERQAQGFDLEQTAYFNGPAFASVVQSQGKRLDLEDQSPFFQFNGMNDQIKAGEQTANQVTVNFGQATATLDYDEASKTYKKQFNGAPHIDAKTNNQLAFTNVIVLEANIFDRPGDTVGHKDIEWGEKMENNGYYISNGGVQKIHWEKNYGDEKDRLKLYDESGENIISINRGKTYIAVTLPGTEAIQ